MSLPDKQALAAADAAEGGAEGAKAAEDSGAAADNSTLPARRQRRTLHSHDSSAAAAPHRDVFRRALRAAGGGWADLLSRFSKGGEDGVGSTRLPRPPGQPNVAITTAIPPNPCGCGSACRPACCCCRASLDRWLLKVTSSAGVTGWFCREQPRS